MAALETAAGHDGREDLAPVVAAAVPGGVPIDLGLAAEFAPAPDDRGLEQAAVGKVLQEAGHALVELGSFRRMAWKFCLCVSQPGSLIVM